MPAGKYGDFCNLLPAIAMITCDEKVLRFRCQQRGYSFEEVRDCIVARNGNMITVDIDHPAYPMVARPGAPQDVAEQSAVAAGAGTELKKLLSRIGITSTPTCSCNKRAKVMDEKGIQWCEENIETICDWLAEEAGKRNLPFIRSAGKLLIRMAIRNAKKGISQ